MFNNLSKRVAGIFLGLLLCAPAFAAQQEAPLPDTFATKKIVLQISDPEPFKQTMVLNVASNLLTYYEGTEIDMEIVAFGPGLRLLQEGNVNRERIKTLMDMGVRFSGCENTVANFKKVLGEAPKIQEGVTMVPAGAGRILQLNDAGWQILKP